MFSEIKFLYCMLHKAVVNIYLFLFLLGLMLDSNDELYKWFTGQVMRNLHVVFTMNPSTDGLKDRAATSPALFNRCVLNWFGDWSDGALFQVSLYKNNKYFKDDEIYLNFVNSHKIWLKLRVGL